MRLGGRSGSFRIVIAGFLATMVLPSTSAVSKADPRSSTRAAVDADVLSSSSVSSAIIHLDQQVEWPEVSGAIGALDLRLGNYFQAIDAVVVYGNRTQILAAAELPGVVYIEANRVLNYAMDTSHLATRGNDVLDGAVRARGKLINGSGVGVAVVDTGVDGTHPDLAPNMGGNVRFVCTSPGYATGATSQCRGPKQAVEVDDSDSPGLGGHGTHVAGTVAGTGVSSDGDIHGAAPEATIYGVGIGTVILVENALDGLNWVLENHAKVTPKIRVVNNSWGGPYSKADENDPNTGALTKLSNELVKAGVTVVFAAGNSGGTGTAPTSSRECVNPTPGVVCVANYDDGNMGTRKGTINANSSRGSMTDPSTWPDIAAPGSAILSTCKATLPVCAALGGTRNPNQLYGTMSGTSMAAPHVSGAIALLYQANPRLTPAQVELILENSAHKFVWGAKYERDPANPDDTSSFEKGHGLLDVLAAVKAVQRKV